MIERKQYTLYISGCDDGKYGENCANSCGNCAGSDVCAKTDGVCPGTCAPGFKGLQCAFGIRNVLYYHFIVVSCQTKFHGN